MRSVQFGVLPPPDILKHDIEGIRIIPHSGEALAINVAPNAVPGIVFQHQNGRPGIESIITPSRLTHVPTLFLYGAGTEPSVMNFNRGSYTTLQVMFKPYALGTLLGINASILGNGWAELDEFSGGDINDQLMDAGSDQERIGLLTGFLLRGLARAKSRDTLIEESLRLIHQNTASITVSYLLEQLSISERQFERRFSQTVGVSPQAYIRVKRFNLAIRLMKSGQFEKLTDVAHALNFYDQSHFIREIKAFSGLTPKSVSQDDVGQFDVQAGYSYVST
jgi:AraC-like DNA-binding protein